ncbi:MULTISPECIES: hypothetical protein [Hydrogenophaga]|jgi:hypothetical protein|uniref:Uncharacterized protein n=1 Tax=Hydrogenophaga pseudoflava TaxID=47421 RepID=A0A4P6WWF6_HYDPS|nr:MULTISPECIES: hypothetical protein [Hydrogenophaga]QBM27907.1 hypothetical protein HPF_09430 [Hydrogenophaga pseudoflava]
MTQQPIPDDLPALPEGRIQGRREFADLVRLALQTAARDGWTQIVLSDPDFADWPLGERSVIDALNDWACRGRKIQFMAMDFDRLRELHPRLVQWRTTWSHIVEAHACRAVAGGELPSAIWSPDWTMERLDIGRCLMVASRRPERRTLLHERLQACWQQGCPSFPATVLGL